MARPLMMSGRGEVLRPAPALPSLKLILINPRKPLETARVFAALKERTGIGHVPRLGGLETTSDMEALLFDTHNDLEEPARAMVPEIALIVRALEYAPSCRLARMSGSGPTCFGLFDWRNGALFAAEAIATKYPNWWVRVTRIAAPDIGAPHWSAG
jgi:4-diphosphocytidyl-2-C-methyl-D-erythritol kinase